MKTTFTVASVCVVITLLTGAATAQDGCRILYYPNHGHPESLDRVRLNSMGYDVTAAQGLDALAFANLQEYDVLVTFLVGPGQIDSRQADIDAFVAAGGALYIHQPGAVGTIDYAPTGFAVEITSAGFPNCGNDNCLTDVVHPITAGLVDGDLTRTYDEVGAVGGGYTDILARNCTCLTPSLAVGAHGAGVVAFDVGNLAHGTPTADAYVVQLFDYLCTGGPVPAQALEWGGVKATFR